jgi:hypothetical protein
MTGLKPIVAATVRIVGETGDRVGQGLCVQVADDDCVILTCYHVVASMIGRVAIQFDYFSEADALVGRATAHYAASDPTRRAILRS